MKKFIFLLLLLNVINTTNTFTCNECLKSNKIWCIYVVATNSGICVEDLTDDNSCTDFVYKSANECPVDLQTTTEVIRDENQKFVETTEAPDTKCGHEKQSISVLHNEVGVLQKDLNMVTHEAALCEKNLMESNLQNQQQVLSCPSEFASLNASFFNCNREIANLRLNNTRVAIEFHKCLDTNVDLASSLVICQFNQSSLKFEAQNLKKNLTATAEKIRSCEVNFKFYESKSEILQSRLALSETEVLSRMEEMIQMKSKQEQQNTHIRSLNESLSSCLTNISYLERNLSRLEIQGQRCMNSNGMLESSLMLGELAQSSINLTLTDMKKNLSITEEQFRNCEYGSKQSHRRFEMLLYNLTLVQAEVQLCENNMTDANALIMTLMTQSPTLNDSCLSCNDNVFNLQRSLTLVEERLKGCAESNTKLKSSLAVCEGHQISSNMSIETLVNKVSFLRRNITSTNYISETARFDNRSSIESNLTECMGLLSIFNSTNLELNQNIFGLETNLTIYQNELIECDKKYRSANSKYQSKLLIYKSHQDSFNETVNHLESKISALQTKLKLAENGMELSTVTEEALTLQLESLGCTNFTRQDLLNLAMGFQGYHETRTCSLILPVAVAVLFAVAGTSLLLGLSFWIFTRTGHQAIRGGRTDNNIKLDTFVEIFRKPSE